MPVEITAGIYRVIAWFPELGYASQQLLITVTAAVYTISPRRSKLSKPSRLPNLLYPILQAYLTTFKASTEKFLQEYASVVRKFNVQR